MMAGTSSRKYGFSSLVILLLVINIAEGLFILSMLKSNGNNNVKSDSHLMDQSERVRRSGILTEDVQNMLDVSSLIEKGCGDMIVLVAPNPCRACVETQNALIYDIVSRYREKIVCLLVPREQLRNYMAYFSDLDNLIVVDYESDLSDYSFILGDGYLYYTQQGKKVIDFHLSEKLFPDASKVFLIRNLE